MGKHIATAFADYTDVWGLSDKVFYSTLLNYVIELELDVPHKDDDIQNIINQGLNLSSVLEEDEEE
jgi:hypothetical protein